MENEMERKANYFVNKDSIVKNYKKQSLLKLSRLLIDAEDEAEYLYGQKFLSEHLYNRILNLSADIKLKISKR
jgi:hypothetical protein